MWKKYASLQREAELCAIFKKKDYENKRGSHSFKDVLIILLACVSKTTIHLLWRQKETQKSDLKFLELPQTLLFISQYCDSFVILFATWNGTPRDKKNSLVKSFSCTRFLTLYEQGARRSPKWTFFSPLNPKVTSISLLPTVSTHNQQERVNENYWNDHLRENFMIFCQILSANSLSKGIEISLENLNLDVRA